MKCPRLGGGVRSQPGAPAAEVGGELSRQGGIRRGGLPRLGPSPLSSRRPEGLNFRMPYSMASVGQGDLLGEVFGHVGVNEIAAEADPLEPESEQPHQDEMAVLVVVDLDVERLAGRVGRAGLAAPGGVVLFAVAAGAIDLERHDSELAGEVQPLDQTRIDAIVPAAAFAGPGLLREIVLQLPPPPLIISLSLLAMPRRSTDRSTR